MNCCCAFSRAISRCVGFEEISCEITDGHVDLNGSATVPHRHFQVVSLSPAMARWTGCRGESRPSSCCLFLLRGLVDIFLQHSS